MGRKTPQEKKDLQYKKDRRAGAVHGYVKSYPRTKARINRAPRHEANAILRDAGIKSLENAVEVIDEQAITRERLQHSVERAPGADFKAHQHTLREWVDSRLEGRLQFAGRDRYFARPYNTAMHRERFCKYLQAILSGRSARAAAVARFYRKVLSPSDVEEERLGARWRVWLLAFFKDEPDYEPKIREWMREMEQLYPEA
jgi:hypothetical protein